MSWFLFGRAHFRKMPSRLKGRVRRGVWLGGLSIAAFFTTIAACNPGQLISLGHSSSLGAGGTLGSEGSGGTESSGGESSSGEGGESPTGPGLILQVSDVVQLTELSDPEKDDNPTLTSDELEICFTSKRAGSSDIWCAQRDSTDEPFSAPAEVSLINSDDFDGSAALSLDGLSLWFGTRRDEGPGGVDIFETRRSSRTDDWGEPQLVSELSSEFDDIPRPVGMMNRVMPLGSRRKDDIYRTYLAERAAPDQPFGVPQAIAELEFPAIKIIDAFLSEDGRILLYSFQDQESDEASEINFSYRATVDDPFSAPEPVMGINTGEGELDPWMSTDGQRIYFASSRSGDYEIYSARLQLTNP